MRPLAILALCCAVLASDAAARDDPVAAARRAAGQLEAARIALQSADGAADRVEALTRTIRAYEAGLAALRESLRRAARREAALTGALDARRDRIARLLGALQNIEASPAPLLMLHPEGPSGAARAGMILAALTPGLQAEADALKSELEELTLLRALQTGAADSLRAGLAEVQQARTELSLAIASRTDLPRRHLADDGALARLVDDAATLQAFAAGLSGLARDGAAGPAPDRPRALPLPVSGAVLRRAGEADAAGVVRPGLIVAAAPRALVTTPLAATILYAGPLLDYGNVIVLEPDDRHLLVLAGLDRVYGSTDQVLPAGAPVGLLGGTAPLDEAFASRGPDRAGAERTETLYMELRQDGRPVDPASWFALE